MKVSVMSMMLNEIDLLPRYIKFVSSFADEWVILDGSSTDGSLEYLELCKKYLEKPKIKLYSSSKWNLENLRNFNTLLQESLERCFGDWVWLGYLDEIAPRLPEAIGKLTLHKNVYVFPRKTLVSLYPPILLKVEYFPRLFPKEGARWIGGPIHEERLSSPYPYVTCQDVAIYHLSECCKRISDIRERERRYEMCGGTELTSSYSMETRLSRIKSGQFIEDPELKYFTRNRNDPKDLDPLRIFSLTQNIHLLKNNAFTDPVMVEIHPVGFCNHKCEDCLFSLYRENTSIDPLSFYNLLKELKGRVRSIEYCGGGEPTLHPNFREMVMTANILGFHQGLITNGSMLEKYSRDLQRYFDWVRISVDASTSETYRAVHGVDTFDSLIREIRRLVEERNEISSGLTVGLKFLVSKKNAHELEDFVKLAVDLGVDNVQVKSIRNSQLELGEKESSEVEQTLQKLKNKYPGFVYGSLRKTKLEGKCLANLLSCFILPDGSMAICCYYHNRLEEHIFGNIRNGFWKEWYGEKHIQKILRINPLMCNTFDCRYHEYNRLLSFLNHETYFV